MDWKREAADKLKIYSIRKKGILNALSEMERLEAEFTRVRSATTDSIPVMGSGESTREDMLINNIAMRTEIEAAIGTSRKELALISKALSELTDEERHILDVFYIHRKMGHVERLCEELCLERSAVYNAKDKALRRFAAALWGVG